MATTLATKELRNMQIEDLRKEIAEKRLVVAKMHMDTRMGSEKDSARYRRLKRELARLLTILNEKDGNALKVTGKDSTVPASTKKKTPKSASSSKK